MRKCGDAWGTEEAKNQRGRADEMKYTPTRISFSTVSAKLTQFIRRTLGISSIFGESLLKKKENP